VAFAVAFGLLMRVGMGLFIALGLAACSGDDGGSCGEILPCGGDVTGTWTIKTACPSDPFIVPSAFDALDAVSCRQASVPAADAKIAGTLTFRADGTYDDVETLTVTMTVAVPTFCVSPGTSCAQFNAALSQNPSVRSGTCFASQTGCDCRVVSHGSVEVYGAASTSGTTLTLTPSSGSTEYPVQYCVSGNELHVVRRGGFASPGNHIASDIVATRK
jgi:hypothetical protein